MKTGKILAAAVAAATAVTLVACGSSGGGTTGGNAADASGTLTVWLQVDAALAGSTPPDVVELGNTEMTTYRAAGAVKG